MSGRKTKFERLKDKKKRGRMIPAHVHERPRRRITTDQRIELEEVEEEICCDVPYPSMPKRYHHLEE